MTMGKSFVFVKKDCTIFERWYYLKCWSLVSMKMFSLTQVYALSFCQLCYNCGYNYPGFWQIHILVYWCGIPSHSVC